jgi:hypothetical protein
VEGSLPLDAGERRAAIAQVIRTLLAGLGAPALAPAAPAGPSADPRAARQRRRADRAG